MPRHFEIQDATLSVITVNGDTFPRSVLAVCFDQNSKHNIISESFISSLAYALEVAYRLVEEKKICAVVFCSAKSSFVVGADIQFQLALDNEETSLSVCFTIQELFSMIEALPVVTVAVLNGLALGGGLELALACDYRVADWQHAHLGLPEVIVGLLPAAGGCCRLPLLIGLQKALELILTGKTVGSKEARELGIVDALVHNSSSMDGRQLSYCWLPELCTLWRGGSLGGQDIISDEAEKSKEKDSKGKSKGASGKGNARARMMRPNSGQSEAPQRQVSYRVAHIMLQKKTLTYQDLSLLSNRDVIQSLLQRADEKVQRKYKRRWSCYFWLEQHIVYRQALKMVDSKSHGLYPAPYMCLLATLQAWQRSSMQDSLLSTLDYYVPLVLSPEAKCLMHAFLDLRACGKKSLNFGLLERGATQSETTAASELTIPKSSSPSPRSASPFPGDSVTEADGGGKKKKQRKKKESQSSVEDDANSNSASPQHAAVSVETVGSALGSSTDRAEEDGERNSEGWPPTQMAASHRAQSVDDDGLTAAVADVIDASRCFVTVVGDVCAQSLAMVQHLIVADLPVFFLCPNEAASQAAGSRIRLQLNQNLKRGILSPTRKMAYVSRLAVGHQHSRWDQWVGRVTKDMCRHRGQGVQRSDSELCSDELLTHIVVVAIGLGTGTFEAEELKNTVLHVTADQPDVSVRSFCCLSTPVLSPSSVARLINQPLPIIPVQFFNVENSRTRCVEIAVRLSGDGKKGKDNWAVRASALLVSRTGKTPIVTKTTDSVHIGVRLFLSMLETFFRCVVYGGHDVQKLSQALILAGLAFQPLHLLAKLGCSALHICDEASFQRFPTVKAILDAMSGRLESDDSGKKEKNVDVSGNFRIYSNVQQLKLSPEFQVIIKESRRVLSKQVKMAAVVAGCRRLTIHDCVKAILLSIVNESVRHIECAEPAHLDLLACLNMPYFPAAHGGPLYYAERLGWENISRDMDQLLCACVYADMVDDKRPLSGQHLEQYISKRCTPTLCKGRLVQTLFPKRPAGLEPSAGLRGLQYGKGSMPWFAPYDTGRLLTILFMMMIACLAFLLYQLIQHHDRIF